MIEINGKHTHFDFKSLQKCGDLIYCDGPLLSHYMSEHGDHYLTYWVDADEISNRWIIIRTSLDEIRRYVDKQITLYQVIANPADNIMWVADVDDALQLHNTQIITPNELPAAYLPEQNALYEFETDDPMLVGETDTYELQVPKSDRNLFTQFIDRMGWSSALLRKVAVL